MALSTRGSAESPLREHVDTRDGRTTIRLYHATKPGGERASHDKKTTAHASERSAKPHAAAARAHKPRKATPRVDHELARTRERSRQAAAARATHPDHKPHNGNRPARLRFHADSLLEALLLSRFKVGVNADVYVPGYKIHVSSEASVEGVQLSTHDGRLVLRWGDNTLASVELGGVLGNFAALVQAANSTSHKVRDALSGTVDLPGGGTATVSRSDGISVTISANGVTTTIGLKPPDTFFVSTEVSELLALHAPLSRVPIHLKATVELTPEEKTPVANPDTKKNPVRIGLPAGKTTTSPVLNTNPQGVPTGPRVGAGGQGGTGRSDGGDGLGSGIGIYGPVVGIAAWVSHGSY